MAMQFNRVNNIREPDYFDLWTAYNEGQLTQGDILQSTVSKEKVSYIYLGYNTKDKVMIFLVMMDFIKLEDFDDEDEPKEVHHKSLTSQSISVHADDGECKKWYRAPSSACITMRFQNS